MERKRARGAEVDDSLPAEMLLRAQHEALTVTSVRFRLRIAELEAQCSASAGRNAALEDIMSLIGRQLEAVRVIDRHLA